LERLKRVNRRVVGTADAMISVGSDVEPNWKWIFQLGRTSAWMGMPV
jgi:hypothetical protein